MDILLAQHFIPFDHIDWNRAPFKAYYKERSFRHLLVDFNYIWVVHISLFWFYTAYRALTIDQPERGHTASLTWSAMALGGSVVTDHDSRDTCRIVVHPYNLE